MGYSLRFREKEEEKEKNNGKGSTIRGDILTVIITVPYKTAPSQSLTIESNCKMLGRTPIRFPARDDWKW